MLRRILRVRRLSNPVSASVRRRTAAALPPVIPSSSPPLTPPGGNPNHRRRLLTGTLAATSIAGAAAAAAYYGSNSPRREPFYSELEQTLEKTRDSSRRLVDRMRATAAATAALWRSLSSVLSSAEARLQSDFELRVVALLADIAAAGQARRQALVGAGRGAVVDWLLESVRDGRWGTQAEAARALAHLIADEEVSGFVLGRPGAVPSLLRFIFSVQPNRRKTLKTSSLDGSDQYKDRNMLVAALMDIITSNCDDLDPPHALLPGNADMRDISAAIEVLELGGVQFDNQDEDNDDGDAGIKGIGIKILGGTTILGFSEENGMLQSKGAERSSSNGTRFRTRSLFDQNISEFAHVPKSSATVPGLWDDLQREHVAVPFASWALANWALASEENRRHIQELDTDGHAIMTALVAPERTVKWHGSLVAQALLSDPKLPLAPSLPQWCSHLLSTASQASQSEDYSLAQISLSTFILSLSRSNESKIVIRHKNLDILRGIAKTLEKNSNAQELIASALGLLYSGDVPLSLEECQRWSGILLRWVFDKSSTEKTQMTVIKILSCMLEDYGSAGLPISQGWLALALYDILGSEKANAKGTPESPPNKAKSQMDYHNISFATQVSSQLATAVVKLVGISADTESGSSDTFPFMDFLSIEPFAGALKAANKKNLAKIDAADSALATLKGLKALAELCSEDWTCQEKLHKYGVLFLLRRILLNDDYEKLAASEAYDASRIREKQVTSSSSSGDSSSVDASGPSSIRVPPMAHLRRHAGRLLTILSLVPKAKKVIAADDLWCKWLDDCASGKKSCSDIKLRSYCRMTLINVLCAESSGMGESNVRVCPQFGDGLFLLNPELPVSIHSRIGYLDSFDNRNLTNIVDQTGKFSLGDSKSHGKEDSMLACLLNNVDEKQTVPVMDVIFVHGLRGGPFNSWRMADDKTSTTSKAGLVESIDQEAGKEGTCWPRDWLPTDFPQARFFTVKYKTNLTQWSGATLPLQEVSSMLLRKFIEAGIGTRPVVFVTHSMGGLVVKELLYQASLHHMDNFLDNTLGLVFYSCPHFGSKLADMPWRMGMVLRPAPSVGDLRSGSPKLGQLNEFVHERYNKGLLDVISFIETQVTPIVEGYGGWALRMEIVPKESAYPGYGQFFVLDGTDHVNSCKPDSKSDTSYVETLALLQRILAAHRAKQTEDNSDSPTTPD